MNTTRIPLNSDRVQQLQEYYNWIERNSAELNLTDYWETQSKKIAIKFEKTSFLLSGESGFYFPQKLNGYRLLRRFVSQLPINLSYWIYIFFRNILNRQYDFITSCPKAYECIFKHDPLLRWDSCQDRINWKEINNTVLDFNTYKEMKTKWPSSKTHILDDASIKSYFYLQLIENKMDCLANASICEIGPGTGNMASLFYYHFKTKLFLVDLPRTFFLSFAFLAQSCPSAKIALPNETEDKSFDPDDYDIIMLTPHQTSQIQNKSIDLVVNIHSMQEMNYQTIGTYFDLVDRVIKPQHYFFCANRMEKIMDGKAIKFLDYPWRSDSRSVVFEPDPFMKLVTLSPSYIRMEQMT